jgi:hypothetical protein
MSKSKEWFARVVRDAAGVFLRKQIAIGNWQLARAKAGLESAVWSLL